MQLKEQGHEIHFLLADREYASNHVKSKQDYAGMLEAWDKVYAAPLFFNLPNFFHPITNILWRLKTPINPVIGNIWRVRVALFWLLTRPSKILKYGFPALYKKLKPAYDRWRSARAAKAYADAEQNTDTIKPNETELKAKADKSGLSIERWYNFKLDKFVQKLHAKNHYNVVIAEYVFNSRVLNNFGDDVLKIIDTHDIFTDRNQRYEKEGLSDTFFSTTQEEEAKGLSRADKIIAIQEKEAAFFRSIVDREVVTIGHTVELQAPISKQETGKNILYVGSGNIANIEGLKWFIKEVLPSVLQKVPEAQLLVAGNVCQFLEKETGVVMLGEIKTLKEIYDKGDIVINPGAVGTGLKIKSIEALGLGKILVTHSHSAEGLDSSVSPFIAADSPREFAEVIVKVMTDPDYMSKLAHQAYEYARGYNKNQLEACRALLSFGSVAPVSETLIPSSTIRLSHIAVVQEKQKVVQAKPQ
jgi:glycosyltransferase involved in cell wall biosynthesis